MNLLLVQHCQIVQIGKKETCGECGTNGRKISIGIWQDNIKERGHMEYLDVNGIVTSPCGLNRVGWEGMD